MPIPPAAIRTSATRTPRVMRNSSKFAARPSSTSAIAYPFLEMMKNLQQSQLPQRGEEGLAVDGLAQAE